MNARGVEKGQTKTRKLLLTSNFEKKTHIGYLQYPIFKGVGKLMRKSFSIIYGTTSSLEEGKRVPREDEEESRGRGE